MQACGSNAVVGDMRVLVIIAHVAVMGERGLDRYPGPGAADLEISRRIKDMP